MHYLDLDIPTSYNPSSFEVRDTSIYDENLPIKNGILEIHPPSSKYGYVGKKPKGFKFIANAHLLRLNPISGVYPPLPDGVYRIKYSIAPNNQLFAEALYFRNTKQYLKFKEIIDKLIKDERLFSRQVFSEKKKELLWIRELMEAAKYRCEDKRKPEEANELYNEIEYLIKNFKC